MIVLTDPTLLTALRKCHLVGLDAKLDFQSYRFPTYVVSFPDAQNHGAIGCVGVLQADQSESLQRMLHVLQWNVPCSSLLCQHPVERRLFPDGNGMWATSSCACCLIHNVFCRFQLMPCAGNEPWMPAFMTDKSGVELKALLGLLLLHLLCRFHAIMAFVEKLEDLSSVSIFLRPILTGFKIVLAATTEVWRWLPG